MKRLYLLTPLTVAVLLLSGCPDTKLPTPAPKVPAPKAQPAALSSLAPSAFLMQNFDPVPVKRS